MNMKRSHGKMMGKTRNLGRHKKRLTINDIMKTFETGEKVVVKIQSNYHKGMPHPRYHGNTGMIKGAQGKSYIVEIKDGKKKKEIIVSPAHLKRIE